MPGILGAKMEKEPPVRIVFTGSADHGKSTLIGRILLETDSVPEEKLAEIRRASKDPGADIDPAFITDQLREERALGKTIDTAQIFFRFGKKRFVIIDTPGDAELMRNMITGASSAQAAVLLVDIQEGPREQTARHINILKMMGIERVIVAINKMDLAGYKEGAFRKVEGGVKRLLDKAAIEEFRAIPLSALSGANISSRHAPLGWYVGQTLLEALSSLGSREKKRQGALILPVQDEYLVGGEKILVGRIASGKMRKGERVIHLPSLRKASVGGIVVFGKRLIRRAVEGENIGFTLNGMEGVSVKRGDIIADAKAAPELVSRFSGNLFWMAKEPLKRGACLKIRLSTQEAGCVVEKITNRINFSSLDVPERDASALYMNEMGEV